MTKKGKPSEKKVVVAAEKAKQAVQHLKKVAKTAAPSLKGHGDYRPTIYRRTLGGHGDYASSFSDIGRSLGRTVGGIADGVGSVLKLFGVGDYNATSVDTSPITAAQNDPTMDGLKLKGSIMQFHNANGGTTGGFRFKKVELVAPVLATGSAAFSTTSYRIQPGVRGLNVVFPLGSQIAQCFQKYILHGMVFTYVSSSTPYSSITSVGHVYLSTLYNVESVPLASESEVANNVYTTFGRPFDSIVHGIECASKENPVTTRYIRSSNSASTGLDGDERLDDVGTFQVSLVGNTATVGSELGHLYVTYDIEFLQPIMPDLHVGTTAQFVGQVNQASLLSTQLVADPANSLPVTWTAGTNQLQLPVGYNGNYLLLMFMTCDTGGFTTAPALASATSDITSLLLLPGAVSGTMGSQQSFFKNNTSPTNSFAVWAYTFSTIANSLTNNRINIQAPAWAGTNLAGTTLYIIPLDNDITVDLANPMSLFLRKLRKSDRSTFQTLLEFQELQSSKARAASSLISIDEEKETHVFPSSAGDGSRYSPPAQIYGPSSIPVARPDVGCANSMSRPDLTPSTSWTKL